MAGPLRILILNPNSSEEMSRGMRKAIGALPTPSNATIDYYTAPSPSSPGSINNAADLTLSTKAVLSDVSASDKLAPYVAVLIACYSVHPLVGQLATQYRGRKPILGIFETSILVTLSLTNPYPRDETSPGTTWGIVTTGKFWETHLAEGVKEFLGQTGRSSNTKFAGVFSTGLDASDFHSPDLTPEIIDAKIRDATKKLLRTSQVGCVVMGCAGMAGLEEIIRGAIDDVYGKDRSPDKKVYIIDGVKAGVGMLLETVRNERLFG